MVTRLRRAIQRACTALTVGGEVIPSALRWGGASSCEAEESGREFEQWPSSNFENSTYLDLTSYRGNAPLPGSTGPNPSFAFNVALVFERANDPTALLEADWGARQAQLETLNANNTLWSTYGADAAAYQQARTELTNLGLSLFPEGTATQYVSSAESRTIWVKVDQSNFSTLFGTDLLTGVVSLAKTPVSFWQGNLSLPDTLTSLGVKGLMFDTSMFLSILADPGTGTAAEPAPGAAQSRQFRPEREPALPQ